MKRKAVKVWVGFSDGKPLAWWTHDIYGTHRHYSVFTSRRAARKQYEDVREMLLVPLPKKGRRK